MEKPSIADEKQLSPLKQAYLALQRAQMRIEELEGKRSEPIAVVGLACRVPGAPQGPEGFWDLMRERRSAVGEALPERWRACGTLPDDGVLAEVSKSAALVSQIDAFEPEFFGISPREATGLDPQQRMLLEVSWEALECAGIAPSSLFESRTGAYIGLTTNDYSRIQVDATGIHGLDMYYASGVAHSTASGRLSYFMGLRGPSISVDTACSSSLVAVHLACQAILRGDCRAALAGGVNAILSPESSVALTRSGMLAPDGLCKAFDARADGFVRGEGCGIVVLKRLSDAVADGDRILALIRGSALNQDGPSSGLTVPNGPAQEDVIRQALAHAGVLPQEVDYIEAHGTGTSLGDPIEAHALAAVFGERRSLPLRLGSVKTNVGHLEGAAGVTSLIKTVLSLQHEEIPALLHFTKMNPHIDWKGLAVEIPVGALPWKRGGRRRIAGVSSFGFSGTNAHVIVEEAPEQPLPRRQSERPLHVLTLTARDEQALRELAARYVERLAEGGEAWEDVCYTANTGRTHFRHRLSVRSADSPRAQAELETFLRGEPSPAVVQGLIRGTQRPRVAMLFTGQGAQYVGMGRELYQTSVQFQKIIDRCNEILREELEFPLGAVMRGEHPRAAELLDQTRYTQPAMFALEYGLAELWRGWGVEPGAVMGHSLGEYVAATVAGMMSLEDAIRLVAERARYMQGVREAGAMLAVESGEAEIRRQLAGLEGEVSVAAVNGPRQVVISGARARVEELEAKWTGTGWTTRRLRVSHAFHSPLLDGIGEAYQRRASQVKYQAGTARLLSNLTGGVIDQVDGAYWRRQMRETVRFGEQIETLEEMGYQVLVEVGPKPVLVGLGPGSARKAGWGKWIASLRPGIGEWEALARAVQEVDSAGVEVDWKGWDRDYTRRKVSLPTYPFQRQRYWIAQSTFAGKPRIAGVHPLLQSRTTVAGTPEMTVWETEVNTTVLPYVEEHQFHEVCILPFAAYLEAMLSASGQSHSGPAVIENATVFEPLALSRDTSRTLQIVAHGPSFEIYSREENGWKKLVTASVGSRQASEPGESLETLRGRFSNPLHIEQFYSGLRRRGVNFGPAFQGIREIWGGSGESLARISATPLATSESGLYKIHPVMLDACLQVITAALPQGDEMFMPVGLHSFELATPASADLWVHAWLSADSAASGNSAETLRCNMRVFADGREIGAARGLEFRRASREALLRFVGGHEPTMVEVSWERKEREAANSSVDSGPWLVLADRSGLGVRLSESLQNYGSPCVTVFDEASLEQALSRGSWGGIIHLWSLDGSTGMLADAQRRSCGVALQMVQELAKDQSGKSPRLWLVTRGAQAVQPSSSPLAVTQSTLWGMALTIAEEHPELQCTSVDLDPAGGVEDCAPLMEEIRRPDAEDQVGLRGRDRFVARIVDRRQQREIAQPLRLLVESPHSLEKLRVLPAERRNPGPGCVEIRVAAAGLNFRDVLNAMGMYPGDAGPLGGECSGVITATGSGTEGLCPGDEVVALATGAHDGFVTTDYRFVARKPPGLSMEMAAGLPIAFLTAAYALETIAGLQPGDRILIHAAAGGVGLAAVGIAQRVGAEIFATAGSEEKRAHLRSIGVHHVFNSRTLDFSQQVQEHTGGRGVDVILNSLAGDFIPASLAALAPGGRFLEIGKRDIWNGARVAALGKRISYHIVDLTDLAKNQPAIFGAMLRELMASFSKGELRHLPMTVFPFEKAVEAYRYMAMARHTGKIVLRQFWPVKIVSEATYLISGGCGALGLHMAHWLAAKGARNLVLLGRKEPSSEARSSIGALESAGVRVLVRQADISCRGQLEAVLTEVRATMPALRGVIHAAGVVDDGALIHQDWSRFESVLAPKVQGSWNLHELTMDQPLDLFILFSSIASIVAAPGQGNYAAANAFEDGLAHYRRSMGLAALSINWGAWADGMANRAEFESRRAAIGLSSMPATQALDGLDALLGSGSPQAGIAVINWSKFLDRYSEGTRPPRFAAVNLVRESAQSLPASEPDLRERIAAAPEGDRLRLIQNFVNSVGQRVLGLPPQRQIDPQQSLQELGLDSLMAVEFRNVLAAALKQPLPATLLYSHPVIDDITRFIAGEILGLRPEAPGSTTAQREVLSEIEELSEEEVSRLLAAKADALR